MDHHTVCRQRDTIGGGNLRGFNHVPANEHRGGSVHPFCYNTIAALGGTATDAKADKQSTGRKIVPACNRTLAYGGTADLCPYNGIRQMVDRGNDDGNKCS